MRQRWEAFPLLPGGDLMACRCEEAEKVEVLVEAKSEWV